MAKRDKFEQKFDFEKEYGFDPNELLDPEFDESGEDFDFDTEFGPNTQEEDAPEAEEVIEEAEEEEETPSVSDAELDEILSRDFLASLGIDMDDEEEEEPEEEPIPVSEPGFPEKPEAEEEPSSDTEDFFPIVPKSEPEVDLMDEPVDLYTPTPEPAFDVEPDLGADFAAAFEKDFPSEAPAEFDPEENNELSSAPSEQPAPIVPRPRRRRKLSKERMIKEVYLPPIIAGLALLLVVFFIGGAISRAVKDKQAANDALASSSAAASSALEAEASLVLAEAEALAKGYDYEAAIAKLDSFADMSQFKALVDKRSQYSLAKDQVKAIDDPSSIPNLSFHCLIADPSRAFTDEKYGDAYNTHYVTTDEFSQILDQLYEKNYVLVDFDSFIVETTGEDGKTTYSTTPIYLPEGKKPLMLTETLVNYETFTIDSDGDGEADANGDGFASRLIVDANGEITCEMVDANGNTVTGAYDLVPILEAFIKEHPDFCYRGARAILAVSGEDGVFGYRIMSSAKSDKGEDYYNQQVEGAKKVAQALRDAGYTIACYTYGNVNYSELSATQIQADLDAWKREITPVLGEVDMLVYAKASDISSGGTYSGNKYNVLREAGFRYYLGAANVTWAEVYTDYVRQSRIMVTGTNLVNRPSTYTDYFDAATVLNSQRSK